MIYFLETAEKHPFFVWKNRKGLIFKYMISILICYYFNFYN